MYLQYIFNRLVLPFIQHWKFDIFISHLADNLDFLAIEVWAPTGKNRKWWRWSGTLIVPVLFFYWREEDAALRVNPAVSYREMLSKLPFFLGKETRLSKHHGVSLRRYRRSVRVLYHSSCNLKVASWRCLGEVRMIKESFFIENSKQAFLVSIKIRIVCFKDGICICFTIVQGVPFLADDFKRV